MMLGVILILLGLIFTYTGFTGRGPEMIEAIKSGAEGYPEIGTLRFFMGLFITSLPLLVLKDDKQANGYIILMVISLAIFEYKGVERFVTYLGKIGG